ncbi:unnamed protein product [Amoebophrya sp. A25]|nr:unnamed protein product [Amoebophrya sp. A25]|eukprot:GSA25T00011743001.1
MMMRLPLDYYHRVLQHFFPRVECRYGADVATALATGDRKRNRAAIRAANGKEERGSSSKNGNASSNTNTSSPAGVKKTSSTGVGGNSTTNNVGLGKGDAAQVSAEQQSIDLSQLDWVIVLVNGHYLAFVRADGPIQTPEKGSKSNPLSAKQGMGKNDSKNQWWVNLDSMDVSSFPRQPNTEELKNLKGEVTMEQITGRFNSGSPKTPTRGGTSSNNEKNLSTTEDLDDMNGSGVYVFFDPTCSFPLDASRFVSSCLVHVDRNPLRKISETANRSVSPRHALRPKRSGTSSASSSSTSSTTVSSSVKLSPATYAALAASKNAFGPTVPVAAPAAPTSANSKNAGEQESTSTTSVISTKQDSHGAPATRTALDTSKNGNENLARTAKDGPSNPTISNTKVGAASTNADIKTSSASGNTSKQVGTSKDATSAAGKWLAASADKGKGSGKGTISLGKFENVSGRHSQFTATAEEERKERYKKMMTPASPDARKGFAWK